MADHIEIDAPDWEKIKLRKELAAAYKRLEEVGPEVFWGKHYLAGKSAKTTIDIDFAVNTKSRDFSSSPHMKRLTGVLRQRCNDFRSTLSTFVGEHLEKLAEIPLSAADDVRQPHWQNGWLPGLDGICIYGYVAQRKPKIYFEVGSGNSTKFARRAISDYNLSTKIISVDPHPRAEVDEICDEMHRVGFEDFDLNELRRLEANDVVFIDNSHRSLPNSDVTVFFMETLGRLPRGCLYGIHDIFLPRDYPELWAEERYYSEQYVLAAYLFGGADGDTVEMASGYISFEPDVLSALDPLWRLRPGIPDHGGGFWMTKG